jgi:hypothetical protein
MSDKLYDKANSSPRRQRFGKMKLKEVRPGLWKPENPSPRTKLVEIKPGTWVPEGRIKKRPPSRVVRNQIKFPRVN